VSIFGFFSEVAFGHFGVFSQSQSHERQWPCPDGLLIISLSKWSVPCDNQRKEEKKRNTYQGYSSFILVSFALSINAQLPLGSMHSFFNLLPSCRRAQLSSQTFHLYSFSTIESDRRYFSTVFEYRYNESRIARLRVLTSSGLSMEIFHHLYGLLLSRAIDSHTVHRPVLKRRVFSQTKRPAFDRAHCESDFKGWLPMELISTAL
jgi:hypothetical protein